MKPLQDGTAINREWCVWDLPWGPRARTKVGFLEDMAEGCL